MTAHAKLSAVVVFMLAIGGAANAQEHVWKHGMLEAKSDAGFIGMVDKGGFAAKRGLKVQILQIKAGATLMKALVAGELDSVDMGAAEAIVAGMRGAGVKIVGCTWPGMPQVILAKAEIKTPADLKGKTMAISAPGSLPDLVARAMLDAEHVPASEVKFATQGADLDRYRSLLSGITDSAAVSNEFEAVMPPNLKVLMKASTTVPNFLRLCVSTSIKTIESRRDDLVRFVAAEMDAYKYAATHRDETVKLAHEMTQAKPDDKRAEFIYDQALKEKQIDPALAIPVERIDWMQNFFVKAGVVPKAVPAASLVDESVREDAVKLAQP
ncbi:MAG TPA: ABC transporter substrate-binding protein [Pseudolabrys sp.]|nr:ABC transporter substrate-binding protein [Pseudolabrys sp.]